MNADLDAAKRGSVRGYNPTSIRQHLAAMEAVSPFSLLGAELLFGRIAYGRFAVEATIDNYKEHKSSQPQNVFSKAIAEFGDL